MLMRTVTNWRQIVKLPPFEFCGFLNSSNKMPIAEKFLERYSRMFTSISFACPFKPGPFYVFNYTIGEEYEHAIVKSNNPKLFEFHNPNGMYKHVVLFSNRNDPMIFRVEWWTEFRYAMGEDKL